MATLDEHQVLGYDLAHAASAVEAARVMLAYAEYGEVESLLARAFVADAIADLGARLLGREAVWGVDASLLADALPFVEEHRTPEFLEQVAATLERTGSGPSHLPDDFQLAAETFHRFAEAEIRPVAEHVHRTNADIPEDVISGLAEIGGFGLSVPEEYGGYAAGGEADYLGMVVATEELSWGSLGVGGSLITRPEILTRAIVTGGTDEQKQRWLPRIAAGELMVGVMVTEPDYGSDVAGVGTTATPVRRRLRDQRREDVGHVRRARQPADAARPHRSRSQHHAPRAVAVRGREGARCPGTRSRSSSPTAGSSRAAPSTPSATAACTPTRCRSPTGSCPPRTSSARKAASARASTSRWRASRTGACRPRRVRSGSCRPRSRPGSRTRSERQVFGKPVFDYQLSRVKLGRMAALIAAGRQFSYDVARRMGRGEGTLSASMVKAYVCRSAEWVTREAMQLHGGMGYAEEFPVSRYFVDARVLSIFEGADETLCLRVIARRLAEQALAEQ